ncbi:MAG: hypothetical protein WB723_03370 [Candidatus Acidiferrales bacterium]
MKFSRDFRNDVHRHRLDIVHISIDKRVLAKQIHDARDPARIKVHGVDGLGGKDRFPVGAGDLQSRLNIIVSLPETKSRSFAAKRNPLFDLAQFGPFEPLCKLRLAGEHDLQ